MSRSAIDMRGDLPPLDTFEISPRERRIFQMPQLEEPVFKTILLIILRYI